MSADDVRRDLEAAREELEAAMAALAPKHRGGEWARYRAAAAKCYALERELAKAMGHEYAVRIEWAHPWDRGAPMPQVASSASVVVLVYLLADSSPNWDGTSVTVVDPEGGRPEELAIVRFERCAAYRFGDPEHGSIKHHPLQQKGLEPYAAHVVENSSGIVEPETLNKVTPGSLQNGKHYLLLFHDELFECIAAGHTIEPFRGTFAAALSRGTEQGPE